MYAKFKEDIKFISIVISIIKLFIDNITKMAGLLIMMISILAVNNEGFLLKISKDLSRVNIENIRVYFQNIIYFSIISGIIITPCIISFKKIVRNRLKNERSK